MRLTAQIGWINAYKTKVKVIINAYNYVLSLWDIRNQLNGQIIII
jgi:hypothetical protein